MVYIEGDTDIKNKYFTFTGLNGFAVGENFTKKYKRVTGGQRSVASQQLSSEVALLTENFGTRKKSKKGKKGTLKKR